MLTTTIYRKERSMYSKYVELRDKKGVNDSTVSRTLGIPQSTFTDWKSGKSSPKLQKLLKIAKYFEVSLEELIGEED